MQSTRRGLFSAPFIAAILSLPIVAAGMGACSGGNDLGGGTTTGDATSTSSGGGSGGAGGATTATTSGTGGEGGEMPSGCVSNADCNVDPTKPLCDVTTGICVGCLVDNDMCPTGEYCNATTDQCTAGCSDDTDCAPGTHCDPVTHACVGCLIDDDCAAGTICVSQTCVPGCTPSHACQPGLSCCGQNCVDLASNLNNCGSCGSACPDYANADVLCVNSQCVLSMCQGAYADCNGTLVDGCEQNTLNDGPCICNPGDTQSCYQGQPGSEGVGPCKAGIQTCNADGISWGVCTNQVLPVAETCGNSIDDDCNGVVDDGGDYDGDGFTACAGDCCDQSGPGCGASPNLVNPGAFEVVGNGVDDDCNPATSDLVAPALCSTVSKFAAMTATDIAQAMDICQNTTANPIVPQQKTWGLISAAFTYADGSIPSGGGLTDIQNWRTAVLTDFGTAVFPKNGNTMAGISTGKMRDQLDVGYANPDGGYAAQGTDFATLPAGAPLGPYVTANGGILKSSAGCQGTCDSSQSAYDSVNVQLKIRVPTNAQSFSYHFKFYSAEFPEYQCQLFNDFYLALLTSTVAGIPADKNISFDGLGNVFSVNNGFFDVCSPSGCNTCPDGPGELACTGMTTALPCAGALGASGIGGASKWLQTDAPITPGETITLDLMTFDVGDASWDTHVLLDNFKWNLTPAAVSTHQ